MVIRVLFAIPVGVPGASRYSSAERRCAIGRRDVRAARESRPAAELPDLVRRVAVQASGQSHARVRTVRHVLRREIHHAAQRGRAVEGGAGAFQDVDPLDLIDRYQIPADAAAIALIHRHAVDQQQDSRVQSLHVTGRAADVDLPVQELDACGLVDCFVNRVDGSLVDLSLAHLRHARCRTVPEPRHFGADDVERRELEWRGHKREVSDRGVPRRHRDRLRGRLESDRRNAHRKVARGQRGQPVAAVRIRLGIQRRSGNADDRAAHRGAGSVAHGAAQHGGRRLPLRSDADRKQEQHDNR